MMWQLGVLLLLTGHVTGYSTGPPSERCFNMLPGHYPPTPQSGSAPYEVTFSNMQGTYSENEQIKVTIRKTGTSDFKGFFIQARPDADTYRTYGLISSDVPGTRNPCENAGDGFNEALSHSNKDPKSSVSFTWTAPDTDVGNIVFVYTIVQDYATFWVKLTSKTLMYRSAAVTGSSSLGPTLTPVTTQSPIPTNVPADVGTPSVSRIDRDPACGVTKGCSLVPNDCTSDCDSQASWSVSGTEDVEFTLQQKTRDNNHWIAVAFSDDPKMGNDSVAQCVSYNGVVDVRVSYNVPAVYKSNEPLDNPVFGVKLLHGSYADGILSCTFLRKKNADLAIQSMGRTRRAMADGTTFFDLAEEWYLFVGHGNAFEGSIEEHTDSPKISMEKINFLTVSKDTVTTPAAGNTGVIKKDNRCGESVGCFHNCDNSGKCAFLLTWMDRGNDIDLTLTCKRGKNNAYCAIGLSSDDNMGDDSVFECVSSGNQVSVSVSYNDGRNNYRLKEAQFGISNVAATFVDGILTCKFSRKKTALLAGNSNGRKRRAVDPSGSTFFDMNKDWNLMYAYGTAIGGYMNKHDVLPTVSTQKADFQSFMDISAGTVEKPLMKVHGILMILAWMFFSTLGIFSARFYKTVWPEGMEWFNLKRWFVIHRFCMGTTFLLTAVSFIIIFVHVGGYAEIQGSTFHKSHPVIGIIVMGLALTNPIMALFRPHPGTPKRPVFNVAHKLVGVVASVCAVVNIFSGTALAAAAVPSSNRIVLWIFVGWTIALEIVMYTYDFMEKRGQDEGTSPILGYNSKREQAYEMKNSAGEEEKSHQVSKFKVFALVLHLLVLLSLAIAVCCIVGLAGQGEQHDHDHDHST